MRSTEGGTVHSILDYKITVIDNKPTWTAAGVMKRLS